jgi:hypothetical protein
MWDTTDLSPEVWILWIRQRVKMCDLGFVWELGFEPLDIFDPKDCLVEICGIPHLAKNERDMGHPGSSFGRELGYSH